MENEQPRRIKVIRREPKPGEKCFGGSGILIPYRPQQTQPSQENSPVPPDQPAPKQPTSPETIKSKMVENLITHQILMEEFGEDPMAPKGFTSETPE
jgi:hypothetical protein